ncbi:hypothetical protein [Saccharomonospora piscinae]|nr:hypothetical protein [Saccharomonospora piscinae]
MVCPGDTGKEAPQRDGIRVEALTESERAVLDKGYLHDLREHAQAS